MSNISYVNGRYLKKNEAKISINDRAYHFGDAVYEVVIYKDGVFYDFNNHIKRLRNSLKSLNINFKMLDKALLIICKYILKKNNIYFGSVYIQVSRGSAERDHNYYKIDMEPILTITAKTMNLSIYKSIKGIKVITLNDTRWSYPNIKTTQLLPNVLAKSEAKKSGSDEAIFVDSEGFVTEGASSNVWILRSDNYLLTRKLDGSILPGITRNSVLDCSKSLNIKVLEKKFTISEMINAKEVFITSASSFVTPVINVNDIAINNGIIGQFSKDLKKQYLNLFDSNKNNKF